MDEIDVKKPYPPEAALKRSKTLNPTEAGGLSTVGRICSHDRAIEPSRGACLCDGRLSSVDRAMTDDEFARIGEIVSNLPVFADCDENGLVKTAEACNEILSADGGLQQVLRLVREAANTGRLETISPMRANSSSVMARSTEETATIT